jgi:hypothetical protein
VLDSGGGKSTGGAFTNISAIGQPGGVNVTAGGPFVNMAGFLNTFWLQATFDVDKDGLPNELDYDNDNDGLPDHLELDGSSFNPPTPTMMNLADTDDDGVPDGWESAAGTDPTASNSVLKMVAINNVPAGRDIAWLARGNNQKTYVVRAFPALPGGSSVIFSNTVPGGIGPWYAVTNALTHASNSNVLFYAVEVVP